MPQVRSISYGFSAEPKSTALRDSLLPTFCLTTIQLDCIHGSLYPTLGQFLTLLRVDFPQVFGGKIPLIPASVNSHPPFILLLRETSSLALLHLAFILMSVLRALRRPPTVMFAWHPPSAPPMRRT